MKKIALIAIIVPILVCFFGLLFLVNNNKPVSDNKKTRDFIIAPNEKLVSIAAKLESNNFIRNQYTFIFYTIASGQKSSIKSGKFRLSESNSTKEIIQKLIKGGTADYWLKIIEGQRVEEITPRYPKTEEGYLFPDSYLIPEYYTPEEILTVIKANFEKKFNQAKQNSTRDIGDTDAVILASLIEREARLPQTKQKIAGVLYNRLDIGMGLQVDASIQYARDSIRKPKDYWQPISASDTSMVSPYNTYKNRGLPPTPICSPGYDSLYAVFHPIESDLMYYITGHDGNMYYAKTLSEHNENVARYLK